MKQALLLKNISLMGIFLLLFLSACQDNYQPKPRGYFRITTPPKDYIKFQAKDFPYSFDYSTSAKISKPAMQQEKYWINIDYPVFNAKVHLSYRSINHNLDTLLNDVHNMMNKHIPKANAINENMYLNPIQHVYGLTYDIQGSQAASPFQFYVTDSTQHFFRGALYFNFTPNNDSLQPVIDYLKKDIQVLIESLEWK